MNSQIKQYTSPDKNACLEAFKTNVPMFFTEEEVEDFSQFLDNLPANQAIGKTHFFVQIADNRIVGCGGFGDKAGNGVITLAWGLIHKHFHKKGLGEQLLKYRLQRIEEIYPFKPVFIDTTQYSYGFFERFGFEVSKITPDYYAKAMHRYDMVYEKKIQIK